jgi:hypothetical protein
MNDQGLRVSGGVLLIACGRCYWLCAPAELLTVNGTPMCSDCLVEVLVG